MNRLVNAIVGRPSLLAPQRVDLHDLSEDKPA